MDPLEYWLLLAVVAAAGLWGLWHGFRWWRWARLIEDTPTSRVRSAAQGYAEITGVARSMAGAPIIAPLSRRSCAWWRCSVEQRGHDDRGRGRWRVVSRRVSDGLFFLEDETGRCIVDPEGAEVLPRATDTWYGATALPVAGPPAQRGFRGFGSEYRYRESLLRDGDPLYAVGWFRTESNVPAGAIDQEVAALLRIWKRYTAALMTRFDTDADGTLTLREWEHARAAAHAQIMDERRRDAARPGVHVLEKSRDERPFLLAAGGPDVLARRYRLRGLGGMALFFGATLALAWILINAVA